MAKFFKLAGEHDGAIKLARVVCKLILQKRQKTSGFIVVTCISNMQPALLYLKMMLHEFIFGFESSL